MGVSSDIQHGIRRLAKSPAWAATAAGTLALGLAASIVAAVLVRDVLLRPLPFHEPERLVRIVEVSENGRRWWPSFPNAADWREHGRMFAGVGIADVPAVRPVEVNGQAVRVAVSRAARGLFETLGVRPVVGRVFTPEENRPGGPPSAMVSEAFWRRHLGGAAPGVSRVLVGLEQLTVVGVLPASFRFLGDGGDWSHADVWTPLERNTNLGRRTTHGYHVVARLRDGLALNDARADMNDLLRVLRAQHAQPTQAHTALLTPLQDFVVGGARDSLQLLLYAAAGLLLVSCLNLAAAILAQGLSRARELSLRLALGATRWKLARHLLAEAAALAVPGAILGLGLAALGLRLIRTRAAASLPRLDEASLDPQAVLVGCGVAALTMVAAGLVPAALLSARSPVDRLRTHGATAASPGRERAWTMFVVAQMALTMVLLTGTGLLVRSFVAAVSVDVGYDARDVLAVDVALPETHYSAPGRRIAYYDAALDRLRSTPGVRAAGLTNVLPHVTSMLMASTRRDRPEAKTVFGGYRLIDRGYLDAIGVVQVQGQGLHAAGTALIDRTLHDSLWSGGPALGDRVLNNFSDRPLTVAGVVGAVREWQQVNDTIGAVYVDFRERPDRIQAMHVVVRYAGGRARGEAVILDALRSVDPLVPVTIAPLAARAGESLSGRRLMLLLASGFGACALLLAAAGVHAMVAFAVGRERRESAIRLALGAQPCALGARVLWKGIGPAAAGVAVGIAAAVPLARVMRAQLFQVEPSDPRAFACAAFALLAAAIAAAAVPARRAARVPAAEALREDA
jgi:predicted permease